MTGKQTPYKYRGRGAFILLNRRNSPQHSPKRRHRDYPRAYGGTKLRLNPHLLFSGLSPRVRGNLSATPPVDPWQRTIPARTGEPSFRTSFPSAIRDYPRAYGGTPRMIRATARINQGCNLYLLINTCECFQLFYIMLLRKLTKSQPHSLLINELLLRPS